MDASRGYTWSEFSDTTINNIKREFCSNDENSNSGTEVQKEFGRSVEDFSPATTSGYCKSTDNTQVASLQTDPITIHAIKLINHCQVARLLILKAQESYRAAARRVGEGPLSLPLMPCIPAGPGWTTKHPVVRPFTFVSREPKPFVLGQGEEPPLLTQETSRKLLRKSVGTQLALIGFDATKESVLDTLTDIAHDFLCKITRHLRTAVDNEALNGPSGFPDVMEQVFHELGIGSVLELHNFYQNRIIKYHENLLSQCHKYAEEYEKLKHPMFAHSSTTEYYKNSDEHENVPELHFPAMEEGEMFLEHTQQTLEPGFQMLQSLEQEAAAAEEAQYVRVPLIKQNMNELP